MPLRLSLESLCPVKALFKTAGIHIGEIEWRRVRLHRNPRFHIGRSLNDIFSAIDPADLKIEFSPGHRHGGQMSRRRALDGQERRRTVGHSHGVINHHRIISALTRFDTF